MQLADATFRKQHYVRRNASMQRQADHEAHRAVPPRKTLVLPAGLHALQGAMRGLILCLAAFASGLLLGASSYRARSALADLRASLPGPLAPVWAPQCANIYKGGPLTPVYDAGQMPPAQHPIPGLVHITLAGRKAHGTKGLELWMSTLAPGGATPIHRHECEEVFLVLRGEGVAAMQDKDGRVVETKLGPNSTFAVLPNARHQVRNDGDQDFQFVAAIDNPPFRPCLYRSWDDPYHACQDVWPMLWDRACPGTAPQQAQHAVLRGPEAGAETDGAVGGKSSSSKGGGAAAEL